MFAQACEWSNVSDGDLIFFLRGERQRAESFESAVTSVGDDDHRVFHVGILSNNTQLLVHATPDDGVIAELVQTAISRLDPDRIQVCSVAVEESLRRIAAEWAFSRTGAHYNDIFSRNCIDSKGREAFYCCQLVVKAYAHCGLYTLCPSHKITFRDPKGEFLPYWVDYFNERKVNIPEGEPGSHPGKLLTSSHLRVCFDQSLRPMAGRFVVSRSVSSALHFVGGIRTAINSTKTFRVIQPRSGELITDCSIADATIVDTAVEYCRIAQLTWAKVSAQERGTILRRTALLIRESLEDLAYLETIDSGKPICESLQDIQSSAECFEFFSGVSHNLAGEHFPLGEDKFAYTVREPWGVVGAIGVWNYPMQAASWKIAPALAAGNAVVYKPSPLAPITSVILAQILHHAGLPAGVIAVIQGDASTGKAICEHPGVDKVSFTGSTATGAKVLSSCAIEDRIKHASLELGGKSACIVFPDADLQMAVNGALIANFLTQGEVCSNASKVLVHKDLLERFRDLVTTATRAIRVGDPLEEDTRCGALISKEHLARVLEYVQQARQQGARLLCGGERIRVKHLDDGFYMSPAVMDNIREDMHIYKEEVFGPVMLIIPFDSDEDAIRMANDTPYGLAAGIFTNDLQKAYSTASRLRAGNIYVNTFNDTNAMVPFGGMKQSGFGRENGIAAIDDYSQIKSVFVNASKTLQNPFT